MQKKVYKLGNEGRSAIKSVAAQVGDILGKTLGPAGRNYMLPTGITNDGRTIMSELRWDGEVEDQSSLAFHEVARMTDKDVGDGTTTSIVVAAQLTLDVLENVADLDAPSHGSKTVLQLAEQLESEKNTALELLKEKVEKVETLDELRQVAETSMENKEIAGIIAEAMWRAGKDSLPIMVDGFNGKVEQEVVNGVSFPFAIAHPYMYNRVREAVYENVPVLVVNHVFEAANELRNFSQSLLGVEEKLRPRALIVVAKKFSVPFVNQTAEIMRAQKFPIILVSANLEDDLFEDVAAYVDAQLIDTHPKTGRKISEASMKHVGVAKKVIAREKETIFIGGRGADVQMFSNESGAITRVQKRVEEITQIIAKEKSTKERETLEKRIASLLGGIVTIFVDAKTAAEKYYLKLKVEDTINSCRAALNDGMVAGAGETLSSIADSLPSSALIANALKEPKRRIIQNNLGKEFDTTGVYDAYGVAKASIANAISVVKVLLTIEGVIADKEKSLVNDLEKALYPQEQ